MVHVSWQSQDIMVIILLLYLKQGNEAMVIKRRLYTMEMEGGPEYKVAAESFDEAVPLVKKWRPDCGVCRVFEHPNPTVLAKEDAG